jgi:hypothetical protein
VRIEANANRIVATIQVPELLKDRDVVNIDDNTEISGALDLVNVHTIRRIDDVLWLKTSFQAQLNFLNRDGIKPGTQLFHQFKDADVRERLAGIIDLQIYSAESITQSVILPLDGSAIIYVERRTICFADIEHRNVTYKVLVIYQLHP